MSEIDPAMSSGEASGPRPDSPGESYDVFLSYNSKDRKVVRKIAGELEKRGLRVWGDWKMPSGSVWLPELERIIGQVGAAVFFVGPSGPGEWQENERQAFHIRGTFIVPVLLPGVPSDFQIPVFLHRHSWIDFRSGIHREGMEQLVRSIRAGLGSPPAVERKPALPASARRARLRLAALLTAATLILAAGAWGVRWMVLRPQAAETSEEQQVAAVSSRWKPKVPLPRPSVAVLTFENRSGNKDLDWLATAFPEAVSAKLGMGGGVRAVDRHEVAMTEIDLLLPSKMEISEKDLSRIARFLGVAHVVSGAYAPVGGASTVRLDLALYDATKGRRMADSGETGEVSSWFDLADRASEGQSEKASFRRKLDVAPLKLEEKRQLRALFPAQLEPAKLYAEGLERYRHFDMRIASGLLAQAVGLEPHPVVLTTLADAWGFLGRSQEALAAIARAKQLEKQARGTSKSLPELSRREIEIIEKKVAFNQQDLAERSEAMFRELFPDDLGYGLLAVEALLDAGAADEALSILTELRKLPFAKDNAWLDYTEADALSIQQKYGRSQESAERAVAKSQALGAVRAESFARLLLASFFEMTGDMSRAESELRLARNGFEKLGGLLEVAQCIEQTALLYARIDLKAAEGLYREAVRRYEDYGDRREQGRALFGLGAVLLRRGDDAGAREISREATALLEESSPLSGEGLVMFGEGYRLHVMGELVGAQSRYEAARVIFNRLNERDFYATTLANLGELELTRGKLEPAEGLCRQAFEIHAAEGIVEGAAYDNVCLGRVQAAKGNYSAARQRYELALRSLAPEEGMAPREPEALGEVLLALAEHEILTGRPAKAEQRVREAGEVASGAGLDALASRAQSLLARAFLDQGKGDQARKAASQAVALARGDFRAVSEAGIAAARSKAAGGEVVPALAALQKITTDSACEEITVYELESLLAAGEIELADGRLKPARSRLEALQERAAALGLGQFEKRAAAALGS